MAKNDLLRAFLEDLARIEDDTWDAVREILTEPEIPTWVGDPAPVRVLREALSTPEQVEALSEIMKAMVHIALHSALVSIDGGSASAEVGVLELVDGEGNSIGEGLHETYVDHLFDTGRLT